MIALFKSIQIVDNARYRCQGERWHPQELRIQAHISLYMCPKQRGTSAMEEAAAIR